MTKPRLLLVALVAGSLLAGLPSAAPASTGRAPAPEVLPDPAAAAAVGWPPAPPTQLVIDTAGAPISREDYVPGSVTLDGITHVTEVRGRGNSTWGWAKKPYKLKLEDDAALVGDVPHDEWVLLAGYGDRSALRTAAAFAIAAQTRLAWTPKLRFVDVVLNGQPQGLYLLTEQVEEGTGRVDLPKDGFLLEVNRRYLRDDEPGFRTRRGTPVAFKDPDEVTKRQRRSVHRAVSRFENVLWSPSFADRRRGYARYINVSRLIDWYLVEELFANQDSNFQSSVNFSWSPGQRFVMGPVWDFDLSAGTKWKTTSSPTGWYTRTGTHWVSRMLQDPAFARRVKNRWYELRPAVDLVLSQLRTASATLGASADADWQQWHADGSDLEWTRRAQSRAGEVDFLASWLGTRAQWLSQNEVRVADVRIPTTERARTVWVPVVLHSPATAAVDVPWTVTALKKAEPGVDFVAAQGTLTFQPGERRHYVPVQVLDDKRTEGRELVHVEVTGASGDVLLGSPSTAIVAIARNRR
ncbi:Calx-beta domain-containing protein [Nocardioides exalbidus]|uniref:Calx-beta domain-containing protein n=1 Tax=Nocardioides exalbidus TaxID=402596 RepID=A0A1H4JL80_9ACTN|nr:CotH kinase family protein [Nocardioides exalbidus]SEB47079.1 Calx-beta domain-containing protein [Nocardioides exalbidus]